MNNTTILCDYIMNMADQVEWSYKVNFMNTPKRTNASKFIDFNARLKKIALLLGGGPSQTHPSSA